MRTIVLMALWVLASPTIYGATTRVGNGDAGGDLEGAVALESGPIVDAREIALIRLKQLNVSGISGLGHLIPELERSPMYMARQNVPVTLQSDLGDFHHSSEGLVFARTFAEPHAATRFFPAASGLAWDQMVALHIHEALHRALPASVRENESVVSELTLVIVAPHASHDSVKQVAARLIPSTPLTAETGGVPTFSPNSIAAQIPRKTFDRPSNLSYGLRIFRKGSESRRFPVETMHLLNLDLYPFGSDSVPLGFGLEASVLNRDESSDMGPLGISARLRLWSSRDFAISVFGRASLNTLSADELKNSPFGRDVFTLGFDSEKEMDNAYIQSAISLSSGGDSSQSFGSIQYNYDYGEVLHVSVRAGGRYKGLRMGAFGELHLANSLRVSGDFGDNIETGRYRLLAVGPEVSFRLSSLALGLQGRFLVDATDGADFDYMGDVLGAGLAKGSITTTLSVFF